MGKPGLENIILKINKMADGGGDHLSPISSVTQSDEEGKTFKYNRKNIDPV